jgi:hypothetical protein
MDTPTQSQSAAATAALRYIYPNIRVRDSQITLDAAKFAFELVRRVDIGARAAYGLFKIYGGSLTVTEWKDIPNFVYEAAKAAAEHPNESMRSLIAVTFIALPLQRLVQAHLDDPETFPCPGFAELRSMPGQ